MSPEAVARERAKENKVRKYNEMESDIEFLKTELESLRKRVSDLERDEG